MERRVKTLLPSWRERKRYLAIEVLSKSRIKAVADVSKAVWRSPLATCGELGAAKAGMLFMDKWDPVRQRGLLRVNHDQLHQVRLSLALIERINEQPVVVRSVGASGVLRKAEARYVAS
jgi:RNase P/RNase MRP subunit POP5